MSTGSLASPWASHTIGGLLCGTEPSGPSAALIHRNTPLLFGEGGTGCVETPTLETGTISTKLADVLEARLLAEDHLFIQQFY